MGHRQKTTDAAPSPLRPAASRHPAVAAGAGIGGFVLLLGALTALGPLSVDTYLPALPALRRDLGASTSLAQLTLTACLTGLAAGQLVAGPRTALPTSVLLTALAVTAFAVSAAASHRMPDQNLTSSRL